jgi:hypothetical protein
MTTRDEMDALAASMAAQSKQLRQTPTGKVVTIRTRAFAGRLETVRCMVDADGTVRVYDSVAGHYTTCHSLTAAAQARVRKAAKQS